MLAENLKALRKAKGLSQEELAARLDLTAAPPAIPPLPDDLPARYAELGDLHATIVDVAYRLDTLLEWADRDDLPEDSEDGD